MNLISTSFFVFDFKNLKYLEEYRNFWREFLAQKYGHFSSDGTGARGNVRI